MIRSHRLATTITPSLLSCRPLTHTLPRRHHATSTTSQPTSHHHSHQHSDHSGSCCHIHEFAVTSTLHSPTPWASFTSASGGNTVKRGGDTVIAIETNNIRYGHNALSETGAAARHFRMSRVALYTDPHIRTLPFFQTVLQALEQSGIGVAIYDRVSIEPTNSSWKEATEFAIDAKVDGFISLGGGSVMDTAKAANLYFTHRVDSWEHDFLRYVNKPIGQGTIPSGDLRPHIAIPTTAGTGSESTGIAIFDYVQKGAKTGIAHRSLRPNMAIVDPIVTHSLPSTVCVSAAFDVLCHALESYTAIPHTQRRTPVPTNAQDRFSHRPMSQGSNRWADMGCLEALRILGDHLVKAQFSNQIEAREHLMFASMLAGIAFGNSGVHTPHAMSYSISGLVRSYAPPHYPATSAPIVPHGMSVVLAAPAVFRETAHISARRHWEAAQALGADLTQVDSYDAVGVGSTLSRHLISLMRDTSMPNGLSGVGYSVDDVPSLVAGAAAQTRLLDNSPIDITNARLEKIFRDSLKYW